MTVLGCCYSVGFGSRVFILASFCLLGSKQSILSHHLTITKHYQLRGNI